MLPFGYKGMLLFGNTQIFSQIFCNIFLKDFQNAFTAYCNAIIISINRKKIISLKKNILIIRFSRCNETATLLINYCQNCIIILIINIFRCNIVKKTFVS